MKINREESKKKVFGKDLKFNKKFAVKTVIGVFFISSILVFGNINHDYQELYDNDTNNNNDNMYVTDTNKYEETNKQNNEEEQLFLEIYSNVYKLDPDKVYEIASDLTSDFTSEEYLNSLNPGYSVNGITCENKEKGILLFVRHLYQKPGDFNVNLDDIVNTNYREDKTLITNEVRVKYYSDLFNVDPVLALAIEYQESSKDGKTYNSDACLYHNNPAGLMSYYDTSVIRDFPTISAGIIEHIYQLKKYYIDEGLTTPEAIREKYSPSNADNDPYDLNKYWVSGVKYFMNQINNTPNIFEQYNPYEEENKLTI